MHVNFNLSVIITLYISQMSSSFLDALRKIICVMLMIKFGFITGGCQSKPSGITWCSLVWCWSHCVLYYHYFHLIGFDTVQLCGPTGPLSH